MIKPITFEEQIVGSKNDGGIYRNLYPHDGILWGCGMTVTSTQIEIASGMFVIGGRMIHVDGKTVFEVGEPIANGYARLKTIIDLNQPTTQAECGQFRTKIEFSTTTLFPELTQEDVNNTGKVYEQELAVVKIEAGNITGITRKLEKIGTDAEKLGGKEPGYYAQRNTPVFVGNATVSQGDVILDDNKWIKSASGWGTGSQNVEQYNICKAPIGHGAIQLIFGVVGGVWSFARIGSCNLGHPYYGWDNTYLVTSPIIISDKDEKTDIASLAESTARDFVGKLKPSAYKYKDGTSGRTHYGMIAQDVEDAMDALGMTSLDFAGLIKSPKMERVQTGTDENGEPVYQDRIIEGEYVYGLRYEEFIAPMIATIQDQQKTIDGLKMLLVEKGVCTQEEIDGLE